MIDGTTVAVAVSVGVVVQVGGAVSVGGTDVLVAVAAAGRGAAAVGRRTSWAAVGSGRSTTGSPQPGASSRQARSRKSRRGISKG